MRHTVRLLAAAGAALALAGCSGASLTGRNVEELLRAPRLSGTQSAVQEALSRHLGDTMQLKYPRGGDEMAPFLFGDFDGDGQTEAAALYAQTADAKNAGLAVLEQTDDGWQVAGALEGLGAEVAQVDTAQLDGEASALLVGYANANLTEKYLVAYRYDGEELRAAVQQPYEAFLAADVLGEGAPQLAVVAPATEPGAMTLALYAVRSGQLTQLQNVALDERLMHCTSLAETAYLSRRGLLVSATLSSSGAAEQLLAVQAGRLASWPADGSADVVEETTRALTALTARDAGPGAAAPAVRVAAGENLSTRTHYWVEWRNYLAEDPVMEFGLYDAQTGVYVRLPAAWRNTASLQDGTAENSVRVCDGEGRTLLTLRTQGQQEDAGGWQVLAERQDIRVLARFSGACAQSDRALIAAGVQFFQ